MCSFLTLSLSSHGSFFCRFQSTFKSPVFHLDNLEAGSDLKIYLYAENSKELLEPTQRLAWKFSSYFAEFSYVFLVENVPKIELLDKAVETTVWPLALVS